MVGDTSDDIPGFPGIGPVKARKILDEGTIHKFLDDEGNREKYLEIWERNRQLIDLFYLWDIILLTSYLSKQKEVQIRKVQSYLYRILFSIILDK